MILLLLPQRSHTSPILLRLHPQLLQRLEFLRILLGSLHLLRPGDRQNLLPDIRMREVLQVHDRTLLALRGRRRMLVIHILRRTLRRSLTDLIHEVDRQRGRALLLLRLAHAHRHGRIVEFEARERATPEVARALVPAVDLLGVCQVQAGYAGAFFGRGGCVGEEGGAGAGADVDELFGRLDLGVMDGKAIAGFDGAGH
jgi:hypothetical protein